MLEKEWLFKIGQAEGGREMKNLKNFAERHIFTIAVLEAYVLGPVGVILGVTLNLLWFLLVALALLLYLLLWRRSINARWVCTKCGKMEILGRYKFCPECGGIMHAVKKEKILCPYGHKVEKYYKFCPKCGTSLNG